jgi:hypothetical protein
MALNPVERRLALLCGDWVDFCADPSKRLLVWQVPENATRLVQCFFEVQKLDLEYSSRDVFVVFQPPFEHSLQYSRELKQALKGQYEASRDDLAAQDLPADWGFDPAQVPDTPAAVLGALRSFGSKYHETIGHLAAVLMPGAVTDPDAFEGWVLRALDTALPERLRLAVVDSIEHPRFPGLTADRDARIAVQRPAVDGLSTAQETFAQEPATGPAGVFRNLMMGVVSLVEKGSADRVKAKAKDALAFARKQGWADQEVVLRLLVAGALLKERRHEEAIGVYRNARDAATRALAAEHPAGQKLVLQTWFGQAGASLAAGDAAEAARCYEEAAAVAERDRNAILAIEAFRMASFCHAKAGDASAAVDRGRQAMQVGQGLNPEVRGQTSMPIAAVDLLRALEPDRVPLLELSKGRLERRVTETRKRAESRTVAFESTPDPARAEAIERELAQESRRAREQAEREVAAIVAAGNKPFQEEFRNARELLGSAWPLESAIALQPAAEPPPVAEPSPAGEPPRGPRREGASRS